MDIFDQYVCCVLFNIVPFFKCFIQYFVGSMSCAAPVIRVHPRNRYDGHPRQPVAGDLTSCRGHLSLSLCAYSERLRLQQEACHRLRRELERTQRLFERLTAETSELARRSETRPVGLRGAGRDTHRHHPDVISQLLLHPVCSLTFRRVFQYHHHHHHHHHHHPWSMGSEAV